ncbi:MAG: mucoidy inhibitor MuiA family protein [Bacteroidales bacterium]|nr:mucoidy inhibitor MuiA family protein [Candidatus Colimorpha merdihippi]
MKRQLIALVIACMSLSAMAQTEAKGKIEKVTIYPNSALVEKSITASLQPGENKFIIRGNAAAGTSDLHFAQSADWFITSMLTKTADLSENEVLAQILPSAAYTQYQTLKTQRDEVALKLSNAATLIGVLNQQAAALTSLKAVSNTKAFDTLINLKAQFDYQRKESQAINAAKAKAEKEIEELNAKQRQLNNEMESILKKHTGGRHIPMGQSDIYVSIFSNRAIANARIDYSYRTTNVGCIYTYDVMLDEDRKSAAFYLKASVAQFSGENWNNCLLTFSTTESGYAGYDTELSPYMLDFRTPVTYTQRSLDKGFLARNMVTMEASEESLPAKKTKSAKLNDMSVRSNQTLSHEYALQTRQSIPSGEGAQMLLLQNDTTQASFARYATPKNEEKVHFTALLPNWEDLGLLDVGCNVYLNNRFVSTSDIQLAGSGDTLRFAVGQDPNVMVKRKLTIASPEKGGFISKEVTETVTITLDIKNTKREDIEVRIKDQIPIAANSEIQVFDIKTSGGTLDSRTGVVRWLVPIKALEQKTITLTYSVKYPKDKEHLIDLR